jgi:hypothetical protein
VPGFEELPQAAVLEQDLLGPEQQGALRRKLRSEAVGEC